MTLPYLKIDKLLELFSSSEDEQLDEINDEDGEDFNEENTHLIKVPECDNNVHYITQELCLKNENISKPFNKNINPTIDEQIKVVELKVKPIMIKDSDSEFEHININSEENLCNVNKLNCSENQEFKPGRKIKKIRRKRKKENKRLDCNNSENEISDDERHEKSTDIKPKYNNECKTLKVRKNRAQVKRNLRCKECNQRMKNEQLFMLHMQIHNGRKETECLICNKDFENINSVLEHYVSFDKNREDEHYVKLRPFPCHLCDLRYKNRKHLTDHLDIHAGQGKYLCPICGKRFFKGFNMTIHLKVHEKSYQSCERCNKNFRNVREYQAHQRNVHGENNITCPICNRPFSRRNNMKKHMETHGRVYNQCILCNTNFEFRRDFNQHMRETHNRVKKYSCSICDKVFLLHCKLTRHLETHNRIKDNCVVCNKEFRNRRDYNAHMRNLHGVITELPKNEINEPSCKMQFKIIHDVQVCQSIDPDSGGINDNDVKINIKIDINETNQNFEGYYF